MRSAIESPLCSINPSQFREIEAQLSSLDFRGIPIGRTCNDHLSIDFLDGHGDWRRRARWLNRARNLKYWLRPAGDSMIGQPSLSGDILVTWLQSTPRLDDLLLPILAEFEPGSCSVIYGNGNVATRLPTAVPGLDWRHALVYDRREWRSHYQQHRRQWKDRLRTISQCYSLPQGAVELLSHHLLIASQLVTGFVGFLQLARPSVILTEFDRNSLWSCLVLAARREGIPTVTLVHGVMRQDALTFSPVLADKILCWGNLDRAKLMSAGEPAEKIVVGGCPRLSQELPVSRSAGRTKLGLNADKPIVIYAGSNDGRRLASAEMFCLAMEELDSVTGVVRLHPSESLPEYAPIAERHPEVRFDLNSRSSLDETFAAADIVVVRASGTGSDALVKRRVVVVLNPEETLTGHDRDLVEKGGCPHARRPEELAQILQRLLHDQSFRDNCLRHADRYVAEFSSYFGSESARVIANTVRTTALNSGSKL